jgi:pimeloyl-ACP methyl ester carboxylesterase
MEDVQRDVANAKLVVIDDAGHSVALERPEAFNAAIEEWLGEI